MRQPDVAAGVVVFKPDANVLIALVRAVLAECEHVFVFVNALAGEEVLRTLREMGAELIECDTNLGIAEALNVLTLAAALCGMRRVLLLDQDSSWPSGGVLKLATTLDRLADAGHRAAVAGPAILAPDGYKAPRYFKRSGMACLGSARPVRYIITSGTMLEIAAFRRIGPFRSDFFIDAVDTEWCFRAWAHGYSCWADDDVEMLHTIGQGVDAALGGRMPRQPRMRLLAYFRNQAHCITLAHIPLWWKVLLALHLFRLFLLVLVRHETGMTAATCRALHDGFAGRLGAPLGAEAALTLDNIPRRPGRSTS